MRAEHRDHDAAFGGAEDPLEGFLNYALAAGPPRNFRVGRVGEEHRDALFSQLSHAIEIGHLAVDGHAVELEVSGVDRGGHRRLHHQPDRVGDRVRHPNGLDGERVADLELIARGHLAQISDDARFGEPVLHHRKREGGSVDRHVHFAQQPLQRADVIFMCVGQHDRLE